jgi:hypothetical protein
MTKSKQSKMIPPPTTSMNEICNKHIYNITPNMTKLTSIQESLLFEQRLFPAMTEVG